jgi:hypothetical protein
MGEYSFFTGLKRIASAKCKNFTEVMSLSLSDFMEGAEMWSNVKNEYINIKKQIIETNDLSVLGVECYLCLLVGHYAKDCLKFSEIKGNM